MRFLCLVFVLSLTTGFSQHKTNEIGVFFSPGTYFLTGPNLLGQTHYNYSIGFGGMYQRGLSDHFVYRLSIGGMYEFSTTTFAPEQSVEKIRYKTFYFEIIPVQMHYIINPQHKLRAYVGLSAGIRKFFRSTSTVYEHGQPSSTMLVKNQPFEFIPSALIGMSYKVGEYTSIFLQPEYRIAGLSKFSNAIRHGINIQLGLAYSL